MLNLSGFNIRNTGCRFLCERFLDDDTRNIVKVDLVDLSYNQLNFSSLEEVFNVLMSWKTSKLIIADNVFFSDETSIDLFAVAERVFVQFSVKSSVKTLLIGKFLFAYKSSKEELQDVLSNSKKIEGLYLSTCDWELSASETMILLSKHNLRNIHMLGSSLSEEFLEAVGNTVSEHPGDPTMSRNDSVVAIIDPAMSDQVADEVVCSLSFQLNVTMMGVLLVVSCSKIQGVINTCSLSSKLTNLEILNLIVKMRSLMSIHVPSVTSWSETLQWHGHRCGGIILSFIDVLFFPKNPSFQLSISLSEENFLIAKDVSYKEIIRTLSCNKFVSCVYLSSCDLTVVEYEAIITNCSKSSLQYHYILNCHVKFPSLFAMLSKKGYMLRELFVHSSCNVTNNDLNIMLCVCRNTSVVLLTSDTLVAHNPTNQQLAQAFQLEPSVLFWKFLDCQLNANTCKLIIVMLNSSKQKAELELNGCDIGNIVVEILYNFVITERPALFFKRLCISTNKLTVSGISMLAELLLLLHIEELIINGIVWVIISNCQTNVDTGMKIANLLVFCQLLTQLEFVGFLKIDLEFRSIRSVPVIREMHFSLSDLTLSTVSPLMKHAILSDKGCILRELFLQSHCSITTNDLDIMLSTCHNISIVLLMKDTMVAHNPTNNQLTLVFQLVPSIKVWKFLNCQFNAVTCTLIAILLIKAGYLNELAFSDCEFGIMEVDIIRKSIVDGTSTPEIQTMFISSCKFDPSNAPMLAEILLLCNIKNIHIHGRSVSENFLKVVGNKMSGCSDLAIIDPAMSDQVADEVVFSLASRLNITTMGVLLVVNSSKIQGLINTCLLSSKLSHLEILNLIAKIRSLISVHVSHVTSWNENLQWHDHSCGGIILSFNNALFLSGNSGVSLKLSLIEENTLIAHDVRWAEIIKTLSSNRLVTSVYLSSCDLTLIEYETIIANCDKSSLQYHYILNCKLGSSSSCDILSSLCTILSEKGFILKELFFTFIMLYFSARLAYHA